MAGVQHCGAVQYDSQDFVWVVYVDLSEPCDEPHELGAGWAGLTNLPDVESGFVPDWYYHCGEGPYYQTVDSWNGGLGHELGHTLGLPRPPGCGEELPTCDLWALMGSGYEKYPDTYLRADNKEVLIRSPFIVREPASALDSFDAPSASSVRGLALGLDGEPVEGLRVSLAPCGFPSIARQLSMESLNMDFRTCYGLGVVTAPASIHSAGYRPWCQAHPRFGPRRTRNPACARARSRKDSPQQSPSFRIVRAA